MAYKVQRREFVRYQPKWLFKFLLSLSPQIYEVKDTLEEALENFQHIKDAIIKKNLQGTVSRICITYGDNVITISTQKSRPYLKFYINENYTKQ